VIIGGESGNETGQWRYRPCDVGWIGHLFGAFAAADVPVFIKQFGTYLYNEIGLSDRHGGNIEEIKLMFPLEWRNNLRDFPIKYTQKALSWERILKTN
jgi:protein gp37